MIYPFTDEIPALCTTHLRELRPKYRSRSIRSGNFAKALAETDRCKDCLNVRRGSGGNAILTRFEYRMHPDEHFRPIQADTQPVLEHEHRWSIGATYCGEESCVTVFQCLDCGCHITDEDIFPRNSFIHTCLECGKRYRDNDPLSSRCSWECTGIAQDRLDRADSLKLITSLKGMIRTATDERYKRTAREELARLVHGEDELVRRSAGEALRELQ